MGQELSKLLRKTLSAHENWNNLNYWRWGRFDPESMQFSTPVYRTTDLANKATGGSALVRFAIEQDELRTAQVSYSASPAKKLTPVQ